jgi:hypothetical protein
MGMDGEGWTVPPQTMRSGVSVSDTDTKIQWANHASKLKATHEIISKLKSSTQGNLLRNVLGHGGSPLTTGRKRFSHKRHEETNTRYMYFLFQLIVRKPIALFHSTATCNSVLE